MKTVFIDRKNTELKLENGRLLVRMSDARPQYSIPVNVLEILVLSAPVNFSSNLLAKLTQAGITLVCIDPRRVDACTMTHGFMHNDAHRRLLQYQLIADSNKRLGYARQLVNDKIRSQRATLRKALMINYCAPD